MGRTPLPRQDAFGERGICGRVTTFDRLFPADPEPGILGMKDLAGDAVGPDLERGRGAGERNFVSAVVAVDYQRVLNPKRVQGLGDRAPPPCCARASGVVAGERRIAPFS